MLKLLALASVVVLAGCANPYGKFYQGNTEIRNHPRYEAPSGPVQVYTISDFPRDRALLLKRGYVQIGHATFSAGSNNATRQQLIEQAEKVGAAVVLADAKYSHTVHGAVPLTLPTTSTSYTTARATAWGPGGTVNAVGSGTTTTYGSQTTMVPTSQDRSNFAAVFFAKVKPGLGIFVVPVPDDVVKARQRNGGVVVDIVVENTPAFAADILPGDLLLSVNDTPITSMDTFNRVAASRPTGPIRLGMERNGVPVQKTVVVQ